MPGSDTSTNPRQPRTAYAILRRWWYHLFMLAVLVDVLAVGEWLILPWPSRPVPRSIQLTGFHAQPNAMIDDAATNALGFTGDVPAQTKPGDSIRILTLGASALFNRRMTERLAASLSRAVGTSNQARQPLRIEVLGAALRSHTSASSLIKYRALRKYDFDLVLIYHGINDLLANNIAAQDYRSDYRHLDPWYRRGPVLDHSLLARRLYNAVNALQYPSTIRISGSYPAANTENGADFAAAADFEHNLRLLTTEIRADGAEPLLMSFAYNIPEDYSRDGFEQGLLGYVNPTRYDACPIELWGSPGYVRQGLDLHNQAIRRIVDDLQPHFIDQKRLLGEDLVLFGDICHLNEAGTDRFIANIRDYLVENDLLRSDNVPATSD